MYSKTDPHRYDDMLHLPHPRSAKHPPMSALDRAAQFSPFAALSGHSDAIEETGRLTEEKIELDESRAEELDARLHELMRCIEATPEAVVTYFVPDATKRGGKYVTARMRVRAVDRQRRLLLPSQGEPISFGDLLEITIPEQ